MNTPNFLRMFDVLVEDAPFGISVGTPNGQVVCYNRAMEGLSGYTRQEVNEAGWFQLVFPDAEERERAVEQAKRALSGAINYAEAVITCKNGDRKRICIFLTDTTIEHRKYNFGIMMPLEQAAEEGEHAYGIYRKLWAEVHSLN